MRKQRSGSGLSRPDQTWARGDGGGYPPPKGSDPTMEKFFTMGQLPEGAEKSSLHWIKPDFPDQIPPGPLTLPISVADYTMHPSTKTDHCPNCRVHSRHLSIQRKKQQTDQTEM